MEWIESLVKHISLIHGCIIQTRLVTGSVNSSSQVVLIDSFTTWTSLLLSYILQGEPGISLLSQKKLLYGFRRSSYIYM